MQRTPRHEADAGDHAAARHALLEVGVVEPVARPATKARGTACRGRAAAPAARAAAAGRASRSARATRPTCRRLRRWYCAPARSARACRRGWPGRPRCRGDGRFDVAMCALPAAPGRVDGVCPASLGIGRGAVLRKLAALAARRGRNRQRLDASAERPCPLAASAVGAAIRKARSTDTERLIAALEGMEFETFRPGPCAQKRAALLSTCRCAARRCLNGRPSAGHLPPWTGQGCTLRFEGSVQGTAGYTASSRQKT